jgi:hypothetical protein
VDPGLLLPSPRLDAPQARILQPENPINVGLGGWWPLDEVSGLVARDISGFQNHGALSGFTWGVRNGWVSTAPGSAGGRTPPARGIAFDSSVSTSAVVSIPHGPQLDWLPAGSVSLWAMPFGLGANNTGRLFAKRPVGGQGFSHWWTNSTEFWGSSNGGFFKFANWSQNTWRHVVLQYTATTWECYIDGQLALSGTNSMGPNQSTPLLLGNRAEGDRAAQLVMANVRCWRRWLSVGEISALSEDAWIGSTSIEEMLFHQVLLAAAGPPPVSGSVQASLFGPLSSGTSAAAVSGAATVPVAGLGAPGEASTPVSGSAATPVFADGVMSALPGVDVSGTAAAAVSGEATAPLAGPDVWMSGAISVSGAVSGTATVLLGGPGVWGTTTVAVAGTATVPPLDGLVAWSGVAVAVSGEVSVSPLPGPVSVGTTTVAVDGFGSMELSGPVSVGTTTVAVDGSAAMTLAGLDSWTSTSVAVSGGGSVSLASGVMVFGTDYVLPLHPGMEIKFAQVTTMVLDLEAGKPMTVIFLED